MESVIINMEAAMKEKVLRSIFCYVQGDALAQENIAYQKQESTPKVWSGKTALLLASLDAYEILDGFSLMKNFTLFLEEGKYTAENIATEVEESFYEALQRFKRGVHPEDCGSKEEKDRSSGGLLRSLPLAIYGMKAFDLRKEKSRALAFVGKMVGCTHAHPESIHVANFYTEILWDLFYDRVDLHFWNRMEEIKKELASFTGEDARLLLHALELFEKSTSYKESLELALERCDAKSLTPLVASMSGLYFSDQPEDWMNITKKEEIRSQILEAWLEIQ